MRLKVVAVVFLMAFLILGTAMFLKFHPSGKSTPAPVQAGSVAIEAPASSSTASGTMAAVETNAPAPMNAPVQVGIVAPATNSSPVVMTEEQKQEAIEAETERLQQWSMNDDATSFANILVDLTNANREIRSAAIEATKQFGNSNAIPALWTGAQAAADAQEQIDYLDAIDFLSTPSIDISGSGVPLTPEQLQLEEQREAAKQARRQSRLQRLFPNQPPQLPPGTN